MGTNAKNQRVLLATMTREPFQPVRLYYRIPGRSFVISKLRHLECMVEEPTERCWQWLFHGEAASLKFGGTGYDAAPVCQCGRDSVGGWT